MKILFVIPGDINLPTGGYRYDRTMIEHLKQLGHDFQLLSLEGNFPFLNNEDERAALQKLDDLPSYDIAIVDGLAGGAMPRFLEKLSHKMPLIALIHHPLCLETGLDEEAANKLRLSENEGLNFVSKIITTSEKTAQIVAQTFNQTNENIETVLPGVRDIGCSRGGDGDEIKLLCVASVIERKNHTILLAALSKLTKLKWHLDCIGMTDADDALFCKLKAQMKDAGLEQRVTFHGALDEHELNAAYLNADVFVLPSLYEGYGMVYSEAIMCGLPIIATNAGAIPQTVPNSCGILVVPDDEAELKDALDKLISSKCVRDRYKQACISAKATFPTWEKSASQLASILKVVI